VAKFTKLTDAVDCALHHSLQPATRLNVNWIVFGLTINVWFEI
jgi:hypothetical protein